MGAGFVPNHSQQKGARTRCAVEAKRTLTGCLSGSIAVEALGALVAGSLTLICSIGTSLALHGPSKPDEGRKASDPLSSPHLAPEGCQLDESVLDSLLAVHPSSVKRCQYVAPAVTMLRYSPQCLSAYCLPGGQLNCTGKRLPTGKESSGLHLWRLGGAPCGSVRRNSWGATPASILKKLDLPTGHQKS